MKTGGIGIAHSAVSSKDVENKSNPYSEISQHVSKWRTFLHPAPLQKKKKKKKKDVISKERNMYSVTWVIFMNKITVLPFPTLFLQGWLEARPGA